MVGMRMTLSAVASSEGAEDGIWPAGRADEREQDRR